jgi:Caspase domain
VRVRTFLFSLVVCATLSARVEAWPVHKRALLVGINDYSASKLGSRPKGIPAPGRDWPALNGAITDVEMLREMLGLLYGFDRRDILTLTDQNATRQAILQAIDEHLVKPAASGDILFFYFAGHGSQVRNSLSNEPDKLDESLVPADSLLGAPDLRDKELRLLFNRMLDRGARLTVVLDNCHSGSGARGLATGAIPRGVSPDLRDVADGTNAGPRPEHRGALVVSAAQDPDQAWETRDSEGRFHGAFSWALIRALRDASAGEPASETFLRAQARLRSGTPFQEPVLAGTRETQLNPFLGVRTDRRNDRMVVAVEKVRDDGTVVLLGGWANGLSAGSELRLSGEPGNTVRLKIRKVLGLGESEARIAVPGPPMPQAVKSGALLEVVGWAAAPSGPLRVWMPYARASVKAIAALAKDLADQATLHGIRWVTDPLAVTPAHLLRRGTRGWELLGTAGEVELAGEDAAAVAAVARIPTGSSLFVQFPAPDALVDAIAIGPGTDREGVEPVDDPRDADYILLGRFSGRRLSYAWMRPAIKHADRRKTGLPLRTDWIAQDGTLAVSRETALTLRELVLRLRKVQAWHLLESPPASGFPYHLAIRRERDDELAKDGVATGGERYDLVLQAAVSPLPPVVPTRHIYVFSIDSFGESVLLFPQQSQGSVENQYPLPREPGDRSAYPAPRIRLDPSTFELTAPYGVDSYFLLTTDEPLPDLEILTSDGVRTRSPLTPLEQLLLLTSASTRGDRITTPQSWSIEKLVCESVAPRKGKQKQR